MSAYAIADYKVSHKQNGTMFSINFLTYSFIQQILIQQIRETAYITIKK